MLRPQSILLILAIAGASVACSTSRNPARGFRLAASGDIQRGKAAFQEFGCTNCHTVGGSALPKPAGQPVALGGSVMNLRSDGYLVTAIINPAFHASRYPIPNALENGHPRMPDYTTRMTVQQLTDLVTYLQSRYALFPVQVTSEYP